MKTLLLCMSFGAAMLAQTVDQSRQTENIVFSPGGMSVVISHAPVAPPVVTPPVVTPPVTNPQAAPTCSAGVQQTFAVGSAGTLDGSASTGTGLKFAWSKVSGPAGSFSGTSIAAPKFTASAFGTYVFQLVVTDSVGQTATCTVKDGAVVVGPDDVVQTGNPSVDSLLGPMIRWGANPWPWYDQRHKAAADVQRANMDKYYSPYWDTPAAGTVSVTAASATVVGVGTKFKTLFCAGGSAGAGIGIIVWYPKAGATGRRQQSVASCADDTHLTLDMPWSGDVSGGSGLSYAIDDFAGPWDFKNAPANFYDNVAAYYSLYYRSGIDDYLVAARKLADRYYTSPEFDGGTACNITGYALNCTYGAFIYRVTMGLVLRAMDGRPEIWDGLKSLWALDHYFIADYYPAHHYPGSIPDARSNAYLMMDLSYCGMLAPDAATRNGCNADLTNSLGTLWTQSAQVDGNHPTFYGAYRTWDNSGVSATLTNGSSVAVGVGSPFTNPMFANCASGPELGCAIWFYNAPASSIPAPVGGGDTQVYFATFVDPNHITLHDINGNVVPYAGTSGTHGFVVADPAAGNFVGFGNQPYAGGLLSAGFYMAAKSLRKANQNDPNAALYESYAIGQAGWEVSSGIYAKGTYNFSSPAMCRPPMTTGIYNCAYDPTDGGGRALNAEVIRGIMGAYALATDPALKASLKSAADDLYSGMWAKPGYGNTAGAPPDDLYIRAMDDNGFYMTGEPPSGQSPKYFGQFFGVSELSGWPAARLGH